MVIKLSAVTLSPNAPVTIYICPVDKVNIPIELHEQLKNLTLGSRGSMRNEFTEAYDELNSKFFSRNHEAFILFENCDAPPVGWIMAFDHKRYGGRKFRKIIHIYVREDKRNCNYASTLLRTAIDKYTDVKLYCQGNELFYKKFGIKREPY